MTNVIPRGFRNDMDRTIPAGKFKDACLSLMDEVNRDGITIIVTKRGKPIVRVVPVHRDAVTIDLSGSILHEDDDIFSTDEHWEAES